MRYKLYDFDSCQSSLRRYGGSDKKASVMIDGDYYMLKFNDTIGYSSRNSMNSSYRNSAISEYISCHIIETLGIPVQKTILGMKGEKLAVGCKDFCENGIVLNEFEKYISQHDIEIGRYPDIDNVLKLLEQEPCIPYDEAVERFWDTFVIDAIIGNFDRHTGNWGYLYNEKDSKIAIAPIYDCGACLYPKLNDDGMKCVLEDEEKIKERIFKYPKSAFTQNSIKIDYTEFINSTDNHECKKAIIKIAERYDSNKINQVIEDAPALSDIRRRFYITIISKRFDSIIVPAYNKIKGFALNQNNDITAKSHVFKSSCADKCEKFTDNAEKVIRFMDNHKQEREQKKSKPDKSWER